MLSEQSSRATVGRLTNDQQSVIGAIKRGRNVVITGPGGTGKTTIINYLKDVMDPDRYLGITAMTGAAAVLIGGTTLHSYLGDRARHSKSPRPSSPQIELIEAFLELPVLLPHDLVEVEDLELALAPGLTLKAEVTLDAGQLQEVPPENELHAAERLAALAHAFGDHVELIKEVQGAC